MSPTEEMAFDRWIERRDPEAFQTIVSAYSGMVYGTCRRILGDATEAEDVTQECFEALACATKSPVGYLGPWLHRVATNLALKHQRSVARRVRREAAYQAETQAAYRDVHWDDVFVYVDEAIADLPETYRVPIVAHFLEGRSHADIAESLHVSRQTVTFRISNGVGRIRKVLERKGVPVAFSALVTMLAAELRAEALSSSLTATLGKLALAGVKQGTLAGIPSGLASFLAGFSTTLSKAAGVLFCALLVAAAGFVAYSWQEKRESGTASNDLGGQTAVTEAGMSATGARTPETSEGKLEAQAPGAEAGNGPGRVFGRVYLDAESKVFPASPAKLRLERLDWDLTEMPPAHPRVIESQSGANGQFNLPGIDYGVYVLTPVYGRNIGMDWLSVDTHDPQVWSGIGLVPSTTLTGRVVDSTGRGVPDAIVFPFSEEKDWNFDKITSESRFAAVQRAATGPDGTFALDTVVATTRRLLAKALGFTPTFSGTVHPGDAPITIVLENGGSIHGRIIHAESRQPLPGIQVFVQGRVIQDSQFCQADATGQYRVDHLHAGAYTVRVFDREYVSMKEPVKVEVQNERECSVPELTAVQGEVIEGRVFNADTGEGIPGIVMPFDFASCFVHVDPVVTDNEGHFRVPALLTDGQFSLEFVHTPGFWIAPALGAQWFNISATSRYAHVDFAFHPTRIVAGEVVDSGSLPVSAARVRLSTPTGESLAQTTSDTEGRFALECVADTLPSCLVAETDTQASPRVDLTDVPAVGTPGIVLRLETGCPVAGRLVDAGSHVLVRWLVRADALDETRLQYGPTETDESGAFRFPALLAGNYALLVAPPRTPFQGNEEYLRVQVGPLAPTDHLMLTYDQGLFISGNVIYTNGGGVEDAIVECTGPSNSLTNTDDAGNYVLRGLIEGTYNIRVTPKDGACCMGRRDDVTAGSVNVNFHLQPRLDCKGHVWRAEDFQPVAHFEMAIVPGTVTYVPAESFHSTRQGAFTRFANPDGMFSLSFVLDRGPNTVIVRAPGYATAFIPVDCLEDPFIPDLDVELHKGGDLRGRVVDPEGQPVADATVFIGPLPDPVNYARGVAGRSGMDGAFTLTQLPERNVTLTCSAKGYAPCVRYVDTSEYPEVVFALSHGATLEGFARLDGKPVVNTTISLTSMDEGPHEGDAHGIARNVRTHADGGYSFVNVPAGVMQIDAGIWESAKQARPVRSLAQRVALADGETVRLDFDFPPAAASINGRVSVHGRPPDSAVATLEIVTSAGRERVSVTVLPDGTFVADGIPAGPASLTVCAYDNAGTEYRTTRRLQIEGDRLTEIEIAFPEVLDNLNGAGAP